MRSNNSNALVRRDSGDLRVPSPFGPAGLFDDSFSLLSASPFDLMRRMQQDMDRLFTQAFGATGVGFGAPSSSSASLIAPRVDVSETDQEYSIEVELPGVPQDTIDVRVVEGTLLVSAHTDKERTSQSGPSSESPSGSEDPGRSRQYHYRERRWGRFERLFHLPPDVDEDHIRADFRDGVLTLTLPRRSPEPAERGGRRIPINAINASENATPTGTQPPG